MNVFSESDGAPPTEAASLRLAVISTPRSGNTWLRRLLATAYDLRELGAVTPDDVDWPNLSARCVLQIHWRPTLPFLDRLRRSSVRVLVLARHPIDVLLSTMNFNYYAHDRASCPRGLDCSQCSILGASPRGRAFLDFACGHLGQDLLSYSPAWWKRDDVVRVRYEDLVADSEAELGRIIAEIGAEPVRPIGQALAANTLSGLRAGNPDHRYHFWQGRPGLWRSLVPAESARRIAEARADVFETLGYDCDPDESLDAARADALWADLLLDGARQHYGVEVAEAEASRLALLDSRRRLSATLDALSEARQQLDEARRQHRAVDIRPSTADALPAPIADDHRRASRPEGMLAHLFSRRGRDRASTSVPEDRGFSG